MILIDTNLLVYAQAPSVVEYPAARRWLEDQFNTQARVGLPWHSLLGFVRIASNPRIFRRAPSIKDIWARVEEWLDLENVWIPQPTDRHREILGNLFRTTVSESSLVSDAHLAALALEHGLTLCSTDRGFARFPDLRWDNPLAAAV